MNNNRSTLILNGQAVKEVMKLAVPAIIENLMITLVAIVDTAMVGSLGAAATAATALNASPSWVINSMSMLISGGATVLIARSWGAQDYKTAGSYARQAFSLCLILGALLTLAVELVAPYYPIWMHAEPDVAPNATAYMRIIGSVIVPQYVALTLYGVLRGSGDTRTPMVISIGCNLLNVVGNFLLIYPSRTLPLLGGIPMWGAGLGVQGAAISTAISLALSGVIMLCILCRRKDALRFGLGMSYRLKKKSACTLLRVGLPIAGERVAVNVGHIFFASIVSALGTIPLSANHLATTAEGVCYNPAFGFSAAGTTMVGQALGAKDERRAEHMGNANILLCALCMVGVSVLMYVFAPQMMAVFTPEEEIIALGTSVLRIIAFAEPLFGISIVVTGVLRGAGDSVAPLVTNLICMLAIRLPLAVLFVTIWGWGLQGAWYAMGIDLCLRGIVLFCRFRSG